MFPRNNTAWVVARFGAYMHYAVPRMLHKAGRLERLYTDLYAGKLWSGLLSWLPHRWRPGVMRRHDGSTDNTLELLKPHSSWLKIFQEQNSGPGRARNVAVSHATGEYLAFLDSDDIWFPWTLSTFADVIEHHSNPDLIAAKLKLFWKDKELAMVEHEPLRVEAFPDYYASSNKRYFVGACMMVVRQETFLRTGGFTERRIYAEDCDLALRFGLARRFVQIISPVTFGYRQHASNACKDWGMINKGTTNLVAQERAGKYPGGPARKRDRLRLITLHTRPFSVACLENGYQRLGWVLYWETLIWHLRMLRWKYVLGFPLVAAWHALREATRNEGDSIVEETS